MRGGYYNPTRGEKEGGRHSLEAKIQNKLPKLIEKEKGYLTNR